MKDSQGNLVLGRTSWRMFAVVAIPAAIAVIALTGGVASGHVPVALKVSGQTAMLSADKLEGKGFNQYGAAVVKKDGEIIPVAASQIKSAKIYNLCQSVKVPNPIGGGSITLFIRGGRDANHPVEAKNLLIGMDYLAGDATFANINIGTDASTLSKGGSPPEAGSPFPGLEGQFGQEADMIVIEGLNQRFYSTTAGEFALNGLTLHLKFDGTECFTEIRP